LVSWKANPSDRAGAFASSLMGLSTGNIISPMTAAEPSM
jgi:hypothetical protein